MGSDVKVSIKKKSGGKMKMRRMVIEPMKNGAMSTVEHEPDGDDKGGMGWMPPKETKMIHPTMAHLKKHVALMMAPSFGSEPSAETPNTGGAPGAMTDEE